MANKRLIGVVTVKDGWAVQSFGYRRYLPLGHPECLVENLDRWGVDEILVLCIDRSANNAGPDYGLIDRISRLGLATPLAYGGGISTTEHAIKLIRLGAERVCLDAVLRRNPGEIAKIAGALGRQAVIAAIPAVMTPAGDIQAVDYLSGITSPIVCSDIANLLTSFFSEILLIDMRHEGFPDAFDNQLVANFPPVDIPLIAFGGITSSEKIFSLFDFANVNAVAIGNSLAYKEHAVQQLKEKLFSISLRPATYNRNYPLGKHQ